MEGFVLYQINQYHSLPLNGLHILDCGCGEGDNALMLTKQGADLTLLDNSLERLNKAVYKLVNEGFLAKSILSDIENWTPDTQYDIVIFTNVLHFLPKEKQQQALDNIFKTLKPKGILVFTDLIDDAPIPNNIRERILQNLNTEEGTTLEGVYTAYDLPHKNMNFPHIHRMHYIVGTKK